MGNQISYATCAGGNEEQEAKDPKPTLPSGAREVALSLPYAVKLLLSYPAISSYLMKPPEPEAVKDTRVLDPESNPYRMIECEIDKLWIVEYIYSPDEGFADLIIGGLSTSPDLKKKILATCKTDAERNITEIDLDKCAACDALESSEIKKGAYLKHSMAMANYMIVARCPDDERVILYSPVLVDSGILGPWLEKISPKGVKAIISSSIGHTMFVKSAKLAYPDAPVIASDVAAKKLAHLKIEVDHCYSTPKGLAATKDVLGPSFEVYALEADPVQELDIIYKPTKTLMTTDLFYGGGEQFGCLTEEQWEDPDYFMMRIFVRRYFSPQFAHGLIPVYRWQVFFDDLPLLGAKPPVKNAAHKFHDSLKDLMSKDIIRVMGAHVGHEIPIEVARSHINKAWLSWTDISHKTRLLARELNHSSSQVDSPK